LMSVWMLQWPMYCCSSRSPSATSPLWNEADVVRAPPLATASALLQAMRGSNRDRIVSRLARLGSVFVTEAGKGASLSSWTPDRQAPKVAMLGRSKRAAFVV
jgi:hypothetical protein